MNTRAEEAAMEEERRRQRVLIDEAIATEVKTHMRNEDERLNRWHLGREIPVAVIVVLVVQTVGVVWWAATLSEKVSSMRDTLQVVQTSQTAVDRRQDEDVRRSEDRLMAELRDIKQQLASIVPAYTGAPRTRRSDER